MADFFKKELEESLDEGTEEEQEDRIEVGENSYTQEELSKLVEKAGMVDEVESKYNTKIDRVYPEFTKKSQRVKELEGQLEEMQSQIASSQSTVDAGQPLTPEQVNEAQAAARKLGLLTQTDVNDLFKTYYRKEKQADEILSEGRQLEKEINGDDGRPRFVLENVLQHAQDTGIKQLERAYKDMHEREIDKWKVEQFSNERKAGIMTTSGSGASGKQPDPVTITSENLDAMIRESLGE